MYKTIIVKNSVTYCLANLAKLAEKLQDDGSMFLIVKTEYCDGEAMSDFTDVINVAVELGLHYINTLVFPERTEMLDNVCYCVWLSRTREYYFNKDPIREKSIWKDVEWGKRTKNYNVKGKDPGNVWIPTEDDGRAHITKHFLLEPCEIFDKLLSATLVPGDKYYLVADEDYRYAKNGGEIEVVPVERGDIDFGEYSTARAGEAEDLRAEVVFDTAEKMAQIEDETVDLIVTSPPYWNLKDYYKAGQIGQEDYATYCKRMQTVWQECYDKLRKTGSLFININIRSQSGKPILLPREFVKQCRKIGFKYRGILIWHKSSGIPTSAKNLSDHHEYVLIFTKSDKAKIRREIFLDYQDYKNAEIAGGMFWNINRKAGSVGKNTIHPAIFPTELINRIIALATEPGEMVVDPFLGSGTSLIAAINNRRSFIGYEYNEGFEGLMNERFAREIE